MRSKKSQVQIQFHWIFVIVAGAIILLFFVALVQKQKTSHEKKIFSEIKVDLTSIFTGAGASERTLHRIELPTETNIEFRCTLDGYSAYNIEGFESDEPIPTQILFAPDNVQGPRIYTWTIDWNFPFKVGDFLIVSSDNVRYIIVYDSSSEDLKEKIEDQLPDKLLSMGSVTFVNKANYNDIQNFRTYKTKFIFLGDPPSGWSLPSSFYREDDEDIKATILNPNTGQIVFAKKSENVFDIEQLQASTATFPLGLSSGERDAELLAAIFAEDAEFYSCTFNKAFKRFDLLTQVYLGKIQRLESLFSETNVCRSIYSKAESDINNLRSEFEGCFKENDCIFDSSEKNSILGYITDIENSNLNLQANNCPLIY